MADKVLVQIKSTVYSFFTDAELVLFGSRARGDNKFDSDYDLLIIVDELENDSERLLYQAAIRKSLAKQQILADVVIHSRRDIEVKRNLPGHLVRTALLEGIRV